MVKQTVLVCAVLLSLTGCVTYGGQRFIPSPEQEAAMQADSRRVQNDDVRSVQSVVGSAVKK